MLQALSGFTLAHASEVQGYLQIRISESSKLDRITVCAKNFEHYPRPEMCESAPNMELSLIEEKGMLAQGQISKLFNRQLDFPFRFKWPGDLSLITWIRAKPVTFSDKLAAQPEWTKIFFENDSRNEIEVEARVNCATNYYGSDCNTYCASADHDFLGHYKCKPYTGEKICNHGWQTLPEDNHPCTSPVCGKGCSDEHGYCHYPGECKCRQGYQGPRCDSPISKPGCRHGTASKPYSCECLPGYTGDLCDQPIRPSRTACDIGETKCHNGGQCVASIRNQYFCECLAGYTGYHCEIIEQPEVAESITGSGSESSSSSQPDQIVLGIVIGVAIVLVVIGLIIGGFICWIRSRNSHFKHHSSSEPNQIMESESCLHQDQISVLTSVQASSGTSGGTSTKIYFENSQNNNSKNNSKIENTRQNTCENTVGSSLSSPLETTEPPSYEEVLIDRKKDSRDDSQIIARL